MTDTKLSALTAQTGAGLADGDLFLTVDVSDTTMAASGTDKKITKTELASVLGGLPANYLAAGYADLPDALGKFTETAFGGLPALFDPANTTWSDGFWWAPLEVVSAGLVRSRLDYLAAGDGEISGELLVGPPAAGISEVTAEFVVFGSSSPGEDTYGQVVLHATGDGVTRAAYLDASCDTNAEVTIGVNGFGVSGARIMVHGEVGQTAPLLDLQDSASKHVLEIAPDGKVGGVTPSDGWSIKWDAAAGIWKATA